MLNYETTFPIRVVKGGSFSHRFQFFQDEAGIVPVNGTGWTPRILVKWMTGSVISTLEWTVTGGHLTVINAAALEIDLILTVVQINALTFKAGNYFFYLNNISELALEGTVQVR